MYRSLRLLGAELFLVVLALVAGAETLPPIDLRPPPPSVISPIRRPAQNVMKKAEDVTIAIGSFFLRLLDEAALQNRYMDDLEDLRKGTEARPPNTDNSPFATDNLFLRLARTNLPVAFYETNVFVATENGFVIAEGITVSVRRTVQADQKDFQKSNVRPEIRYAVYMSGHRARLWTDGTWSPARPDILLAEAHFTVFPFLSEREKLLRDGNMEWRILKASGLRPVRPLQVPELPLELQVPLALELDTLGLLNDTSALAKLCAARDPEAEYLMGLHLEKAGRTGEAQGYFQKSAEHGFRLASHRAARLMLRAEGSKADAVAVLHRAANQMEPHALALLGFLLCQPGETFTDETNGLRYLEYTARLGDPWAEFALESVRRKGGMEEALKRNFESPSGYIPAKPASFEAAVKARIPEAMLELSKQLPPSRSHEQFAWVLSALINATNATVVNEQTIRKGAVEELHRLRKSMSPEELQGAIQTIYGKTGK